ncbi:uncharacterized protein K452DRAFT_235057 [Aplosporella prunicola CBS 121167]|uniref:Aromatic prenyltransferase n=1 Tax=Aplosporella prunicola CBS 121167 TaxID=1176127 RepID=A0A6A6B4P4_9PEZI|nr:uncharacterized protein K452DRAFT_235057 [Aplosporella prunicola CBS 121167]KAF2138184.1 hypothetical protein K452DRAFT_235057 [Aplosporella prunicola CBS 121167]
MMQEAKYPETVQQNFLGFYRDTICPLLGARPNSSSIGSGLSRDGNPFEYSFELKDSAAGQTVRFCVDLSELRPSNKTNPLSIEATQKVVDVLQTTTPGFDNKWYRHLSQWFLHHHLPASQQQDLIAKAGQHTSLILGFDIRPNPHELDSLPALAKIYFTPCVAAAAKGITRWQAVRQAIRHLPDVGAHPNILASLAKIEDYLADKPQHFEHTARYLATDFVAPAQSRLKIYMRFPSADFDAIWDFYTLGGRIPGLADDKQKLRDLMQLISGGENSGADREMENPDKYTAARKKATVLYFSLSPRSPFPGPKVYFCPANTAANDAVIARGLDAWLRKYQWSDGDVSIQDRIESVL